MERHQTTTYSKLSLNQFSETLDSIGGEVSLDDIMPYCNAMCTLSEQQAFQLLSQNFDSEAVAKVRSLYNKGKISPGIITTVIAAITKQKALDGKLN